MKLYVASGVREATGLSYRQFDHWTREGLLRPAEVEGSGTGTGHVRIYDESEVEFARMLANFANVRKSAETLRNLVEYGSVTVGGRTLRIEPAEAVAR